MIVYLARSRERARRIGSCARRELRRGRGACEKEGSEGSRTLRRLAARSPMRGRRRRGRAAGPRGSSAISDRHWRARARCLAQRTVRAPCAKVGFCWRARGTREHARRGSGVAQGLPVSPKGRKDLRPNPSKSKISCFRTHVRFKIFQVFIHTFTHRTTGLRIRH